MNKKNVRHDNVLMLDGAGGALFVAWFVCEEWTKESGSGHILLIAFFAQKQMPKARRTFFLLLCVAFIFRRWELDGRYEV